MKDFESFGDIDDDAKIKNMTELENEFGNDFANSDPYYFNATEEYDNSTTY